jgi:hypothetical protein
MHNGSQGESEPIESSIAEISTFEPHDIMVCSAFLAMQHGYD